MAALLLCGCQPWHEETLFDTPFAYIQDDSGASSTTIDSQFRQGQDNILSALNITVSISRDKFTGPVQVTYECKAGDGLKEGVDYKIQPSTASPVTFEKGTYSMPVRVMWLRTDGWEAKGDCTLEIVLTGSSLEDMQLGYPGPSSLKKSYIFTKQ